MVSHKLLFSEPGTGTINELKKLALATGRGFSYRSFTEQEDSFLDTLTDGSIDAQLLRSPALLMVFDGFEHLSDADLEKLVDQINAWTFHNPDLPITVYWTVSEQDIRRALELAEKILPLTR